MIMAKLTLPSGVSLRAARVAGNPRTPNSPVGTPGGGKIAPAPPASEVPAPVYPTFEHPVPKVTWPMKTEASLQSVSEALGAAKTQMMGAPLLATEQSAGSHIKTTGAVEHDLKEVSVGIASEDLADERE
jgi:hypothetical protein